MNYKERKQARLMFLFPLMLALTGLALLLLAWALTFEDLNALRELTAMLKQSWYILLLPLVLMLLYLVRIPPLGAYIGAGVGALLCLIQLIIAFLVSRSGSADGLAAWVPGHDLFLAIGAIKNGWTLATGLDLFGNLCLVLTNVSAIFSGVYYAHIKGRADLRRQTVPAGSDSDLDAESDPDL